MVEQGDRDVAVGQALGQDAAGASRGDHQQLQQFVTTSTWDHVEVRRRLAVWARDFVDPDAFAVDDTAFPKDGYSSPGWRGCAAGRWASARTARSESACTR
ncbi:transposase [Saccharothrix saharensis]|uniref:transposase n=1 Tax=Saccharothrix saharensis TaxID=571190 RepID=UPI003675332E